MGLCCLSFISNSIWVRRHENITSEVNLKIRQVSQNSLCRVCYWCLCFYYHPPKRYKLFKQQPQPCPHKNLIMFQSLLAVNSTGVSRKSWEKLGTTGFNYVSINVPPNNSGFHTIKTANDAVTFGGYVYGKGDLTAYAAPLVIDGVRPIEVK